MSSAVRRIAVVGLGYVGLPLAVALARHFEVTGFDIDAGRVDELRRGHDRTREADPAALKAKTLRFAADEAAIAGHDLYVVATPTPVDRRNRPDLAALLAACGSVGRRMGRGAIVVFESTVYPGVTEDICGPALAAASGLACGTDFFLGYSPERINPGDREHTLERIAKVVAGQTPAVLEALAAVYGRVTAGGVFRAKSIRVAEAAKVIENAQRDINIAFVNEVTMIFHRLGISIYDVLETSATKWNFLPFRPGLVGGHCIGVDPFYLADAAMRAGHSPEIILAGRRINDSMSLFVADCIDEALEEPSPKAARDILVLGLTFKEDVPDLRNTKVIDLVRRLESHGHRVAVHDPVADPDEAKAVYGIELRRTLENGATYDCVAAAVAHAEFRGLGANALARLVRPGGLVADIKGVWRTVPLPPGLRRWEM